MRTYRIAWRNLWRNRRRTLITMASVFFGVLLATVMSSMQEGSYSNMINNVVKFYSGYIQIHDQEYWENKTLYYSFEMDDSLYKEISLVEEIKSVIPRLESFALLSTGDLTQPSMVIGVEPGKENELTNLSQWVIRGDYFDNDENAVLIGETLARNLDSGVGDTLAFLSQGYYGSTVAAEFVIAGILKFPSPDLNKGFAYMRLDRAQQFFYADGMLTSLSIMVEDYEKVEPAMKKLDQILDDRYEAMSWDEMQPELVQMIESDRAGGIIMKAILYMIIAFGILGTILMMMSERRREMGIMVAVGMKKHKLAGILFLELVYMGLLGVIAGILASFPIIAVVINNPIPITGDAAQAMLDMGIEPSLVFSATPPVFYNQLITVFIIAVGIALYPVIKVLGMKEIEYLRH